MNNMFQHRHYAVIAALLRQHDAPTELVTAFARAFQRDNQRFDYIRFMDAVEGHGTNKDNRTAKHSNLVEG